MEYQDILFMIAAVLNIVGIIGSVVPGLPGPPLCLAALILCCIALPSPIAIIATVILAIVVLFAVIMDYVAPGILANKAGGGKKATWGANIGMIVGLFFTPWGIIVGPFLGAFLGETLDGSDLKKSLKISGITVLTLAISTLFKLLLSISILLVCIGCGLAYYLQ